MIVKLTPEQTLDATRGRAKVAVEVNGRVDMHTVVVVAGEPFIVVAKRNVPLRGLKWQSGGVSFYVEGC